MKILLLIFTVIILLAYCKSNIDNSPVMEDTTGITNIDSIIQSDLRQFDTLKIDTNVKD